ncbi:MAG TPA: SH3 domain-containing protein [Deltaproteobacteria bacterium]|nr:SH3 domain-containing protein [Deltaproteobacteria bacterium]
MGTFTEDRKGKWARCVLAVMVAVTVVGSGCARKVVVVNYLGSPALAPGTDPAMNTAGFWIDRCAAVDEVIMDARSIALFNEQTRQRTRAVTDVTRLSDKRSGKALRDSLERMYASILLRGYVDADGKKALGMLEEIKGNMALDSIPETVDVRWALVARFTDQRLLPTTDALYKDASDRSIDRLQNNTLDLASEVAVCHESKDGGWTYVIGPYSEGWVRSSDIAVCERGLIERYRAWEPFVVTLQPKTDLFLDPMLRRRAAWVQMGTRLPLLERVNGEVSKVLVPVRGQDGTCVFDAAYVATRDTSEGYLPYTPRNALVQAFRLLNAPYGWGGMYGEQDCSRLVQQVFATFGILMPRNSSQQARVGKVIADLSGEADPAQRRAAITQLATPGITTLQFPGHIMLYIGHVSGIPYAIHDLHAYTEKVDGEERTIALARVCVTSLDLGGTSSRGSFLMRIANVREIALEGLTP